MHAIQCEDVGEGEVALDIRDRTDEVRLPAVPTPYADFLIGEIRRFAITAAVER